MSFIIVKLIKPYTTSYGHVFKTGTKQTVTPEFYNELAQGGYINVPHVKAKRKSKK